MTLPDERYRAVIQTKNFLEELLTTPRIPKAVKQSAKWCLRHYPNEWEMRLAAKDCPDVFQERMEPLTRMLEVYKIEQKEEQNGKVNETSKSQ